MFTRPPRARNGVRRPASLTELVEGLLAGWYTPAQAEAWYPAPSDPFYLGRYGHGSIDPRAGAVPVGCPCDFCGWARLVVDHRPRELVLDPRAEHAGDPRAEQVIDLRAAEEPGSFVGTGISGRSPAV